MDELDIKYVLIIMAVLLFLIFVKVATVAARMREHFPTEKERDSDWAKNDPIGHAEATQK